MKLQGSRFAFITDLHGKDPKKHIQTLKKNPVDLIVLGGDIPDCTQRNLTSIIKKFLKLNIPVIIFPGSHENSITYNKALSKINNKNLIDASKPSKRRIQFGNNDLIIIPGSDSISSGTKPYNGGSYWLFDKKSKKKVKDANKKIKEIKFAKKASPVFIEDIRTIMRKGKRSKPSHRILLTHIPHRCKTTKGIDVAHFGQATKDFIIKKAHQKLRKSEMPHVEKGNIFPLKEALAFKKKGYPIKIKKKNVGSKLISTFMKKYSITKFVCGHIHEAGLRAISKTEKVTKPKTHYKNISINSGMGTTIISCKGERISYEFK